MRGLSVTVGLLILAIFLVPLALGLWLARVELGLLAGAAAGVFTLLNLGWAARSIRTAAAKEEQDSPRLAILSASVLPVTTTLGVVFGLQGISAETKVG